MGDIQRQPARPILLRRCYPGSKQTCDLLLRRSSDWAVAAPFMRLPFLRRIAVTLPATRESPLPLDDAHQHRRTRTVSVPGYRESTFRTWASCKNKPETDQPVRRRVASASSCPLSVSRTYRVSSSVKPLSRTSVALNSNLLHEKLL